MDDLSPSLALYIAITEVNFVLDDIQLLEWTVNLSLLFPRCTDWSLKYSPQMFSGFAEKAATNISQAGNQKQSALGLFA